MCVCVCVCGNNFKSFHKTIFVQFLWLLLLLFIYASSHMGQFDDTPIWVVKRNKQRGKTFKYVDISAKELLNHIPLAVNSL